MATTALHQLLLLWKALLPLLLLLCWRIRQLLLLVKLLRAWPACAGECEGDRLREQCQKTVRGSALTQQPHAVDNLFKLHIQSTSCAQQQCHPPGPASALLLLMAWVLPQRTPP